MATTFYLPSSGSPSVTPTDDHTSWEAKSTAMAWFKAVTTKGTTVMTTISANESSVNPAAQKSGHGWVYGPLAANAISGTLDYQLRGRADTFSNYYRACMAAYIMKPDGTIRSTLLAAESSIDDVDFTTSYANYTRSGISITSQTPTAGDYLVIEFGGDNSTDGFVDVESFDLEIGDLHATNYGYVTFSATISLQAPTSLTYDNDGQSVRPSVAMTTMNPTVAPSGIAASCTFTVQSGALPVGVSLNASSGTISGTPTVTGNYTFVIRATNGGGSIDSASLTMGVRQVGGSISMNINI